jgi:hypothetical protein
LATLRAAASTAKDSPTISVLPLGVLAHHALVVGVGDVLAEHVLDLAARHGGLQRLVDAADPLLLDRHGVDRGDLELGLGEGGAGELSCVSC